MKFLITSSVAAIVIGAGVLLFPTPATGQGAENVTKAEYTQTSQATNLHPTELVELFTSQGCSSCPPADKFIASLADSPTTLALSFNVTYWDYLGWKDRFGQREFTKRQKQYARSLGVGNVYTPQMVVNGATHSNRLTRKQIMAASLSDDRPMYDLTPSGSILRVSAENDAALSSSKLTLVAYKPGLQRTPVSAGENNRRTLENYNVVKGVYEMNAETGYSVDRSDHEDGLAYVLLASDVKTAEIVSMTQMLP